jgi:hypothetical protein
MTAVGWALAHVFRFKVVFANTAFIAGAYIDQTDICVPGNVVAAFG